MPTETLLTGKVVTDSSKWYNSVAEGIMQGIIQVDYWTNFWLPRKKIERLEVYYKGNCVLEGRVLSTYRETPVNVFNAYKNGASIFTRGQFGSYKDTANIFNQVAPNELHSIGLQPHETISDFQKLLNATFRDTCASQIGNIIFLVDGVSLNEVSSTKIIKLKVLGQDSLPDGVRALSTKVLNQTVNRIAYAPLDISRIFG